MALTDERHPATPRPAGITEADIERRFTHHRPEGSKVDEHNSVRAAYKAFAVALTNLPEGREKSLAFTALEESSFWAHAAVAREGK